MAVEIEQACEGRPRRKGRNGEAKAHSGIIGAHGSFGGSLAVPLVLYVYALVRGPLRYRGLVWVGVLEQGVAIFFTLYHTAFSPMKAEAIVTPLIVSIALLVLLLANLPTGEPTT